VLRGVIQGEALPSSCEADSAVAESGYNGIVPIALEKKLQIVLKNRLQGSYRGAFRLATQLTRQAKKEKNIEIELRALWEAMDAGKVVCPERKKLLRGLGLSSLKIAEELMRLPRPDFIGTRNDGIKLEAWVRWGALLRVLGEHEKAVQVLRECLKKRGDPQLKAFALWNLGFALRMCLKLKEARGCFLESRKIFEKLGDTSGKAYALCALAGVTRLLGGEIATPQQKLGLAMTNRSLDFYRQALKMFQRDRDPYGIAYGNCGIGNSLRKQGKFKEAVSRYNKSQKLYRKLGDRVNEGYVLWGRATCHKALGESQKAKQDIVSAERFFRKGQDERGMALIATFENTTGGNVSRHALKEARLS